MAQVLVLNQDYQAISLCAPERAIVLVLMKKAELVSDVTSQKMRSVKQEFKFPSVIRLHQFVYLPFKKVALTRENVFKRDGHECVYCGSTKNLTLDHLVPRAQGGRCRIPEPKVDRRRAAQRLSRCRREQMNLGNSPIYDDL